MLVIERIYPLFLIREILVDGRRPWSAFLGETILLLNQFPWLVHLIQVLFEYSDILGIAFDCGVSEVADEGYEPDEEVDDHVNDHMDLDRVGQASLDPTHAPDEVECQQHVQTVAYGRHKADDGGPAEAETEEIEEAEVETICGLASSGKDFGIVRWDIGGYLLLDFLHLAGLAGVRDHLVVRVIL